MAEQTTTVLTPEQEKERKEKIALALKEQDKKFVQISREFEIKKSEVALVMSQVLKSPKEHPTTLNELRYFLKIAKESGLSPFLKEIWGYKDNKGNLIIFAGRDGFRKMAHDKDPQFKSLNSFGVYDKDKFNLSIEMGTPIVKHEINPLVPRGSLIGAYAIYERKDGGVSIEYVDMKTYNKNQNVWGTHPEEMIKKVAEVHVCKKMVSIGAIYAEEEFKIDRDKNVVLDEIRDDEFSTELRDKIKEINTIEGLNKFYDENKNKYNKNTFNKLIAQKQNELENL